MEREELSKMMVTFIKVNLRRGRLRVMEFLLRSLSNKATQCTKVNGETTPIMVMVQRLGTKLNANIEVHTVMVKDMAEVLWNFMEINMKVISQMDKCMVREQ